MTHHTNTHKHTEGWLNIQTRNLRLLIYTHIEVLYAKFAIARPN